MNESDGSLTASKLFDNAVKNQTVAAVLPNLANVVQVDASATMLEAANLLWNNSLLALPVWDDVDKKYIGFFDMRDILRAIIQVQDNNNSNGSRVEESVASDDDDDFDELLSKTLQELTLSSDHENSLKSLAARRPVYTIGPDDSLEALCQLLSKFDCRRVLICSKPSGERCSDMVSRSTLIKFLASKLPNVTGTLDQAGLDYRKEVVSIRDDASAKEAFELILSKKLYGIAVVDEDGGLLGNTSARDIKLVALYKGCNAMDMDILSYLASVRQEDSVENGKKAKYPACNVRESTTVGHVMSLLAKTGYHRVFVTNTYVEPVGVISEQDILCFLLEKGKLQLPHDLPDLAE